MENIYLYYNNIQSYLNNISSNKPYYNSLLNSDIAILDSGFFCILLRLFKKYENLMNKEAKNNIFFEGRLARYTYYNTDEVIERALDLYLNLKKKFKKIKN